MTVEQVGVIDVISVDIETDEVRLAISDHLEWDSKNEHLLILQDKINNYLAFVESGEIYDSYPAATGRNIRIELICKYHPSPFGLSFLERVQSLIRDAGFEFSFRVLNE